MKIGIYEDEYYPYYALDESWTDSSHVEITPEFKQRYDRIIGEFMALQRELAELYKARKFDDD